jgi:preprotein translocase subunit YajC
MTLAFLNILLAFGPPPAPAGTQPNPTGQMVYTLGMFGLMAVIFYFLLIRPQRVRAKQHEALLQNIKPGDKIITSSGMIAVVISVKEKTLNIRCADSKLEILKSAVSEIIERAGESSQSNP